MTKEDAFTIILLFAIAHAIIAGLLAQTVVGDTALLTALTGVMVYVIGKQSKVESDMRTVMTIGATAFGKVAGVYIVTKLFAWIPGIGNLANAATTFTVTQVIGWSAFYYFNQNATGEGS